MSMDHDEIVGRTIESLKRRGYRPLAFVKYTSNGYDGEFDILNYEDGCMAYYEIKRSSRRKSRNKAINQFKRAIKAYPDRRWRFYFVTSKEIELVNI